VVAALLVLQHSTSYGVDNYPSSIVLQTGKVLGPPNWVVGFPRVGDTLTVVGLVDHFNNPLEDLGASSDSIEYTYVFSNLVCAFAANVHCTNGIEYSAADFPEGTLRVYLDESPDASFLDASSFFNGEVLLEAEVTSLNFGSCDYWNPNIARGEIQFTGGRLFPRVSEDEIGWRGTTDGSYLMIDDETLIGLGYVLSFESTISLVDPTSVEPMTWGRLKNHFRTRE
jgi:hypothetical protein